MKLVKRILAIAIISLVVVSCKNEKKNVEATTNEVEISTNMDMANHVCNENCKEGNCPHHTKKAEHKCDENCKGGNCPHHAKKEEHKCDENCKEGNCPHHAAKDEHKCSDAKCSADCTEKDCSKCAEKHASCKKECATKKA